VRKIRFLGREDLRVEVAEQFRNNEAILGLLEPLRLPGNACKGQGRKIRAEAMRQSAGGNQLYIDQPSDSIFSDTDKASVLCETKTAFRQSGVVFSTSYLNFLLGISAEPSHTITS
jgi:hypothetical protein